MFDHYLSGWWSSRFIQEIDRNDLSMTSQELSEKVVVSGLAQHFVLTEEE
jgi:hypothetical protein